MGSSAESSTWRSPMQARSLVPRGPIDDVASRPPVASAGRADAEPAALALLCLLSAWPPEEPHQLHLRLVSQ